MKCWARRPWRKMKTPPAASGPRKEVACEAPTDHPHPHGTLELRSTRCPCALRGAREFQGRAD
eukprot:4023737-Pyramimonas_sp.AAC.1